MAKPAYKFTEFVDLLLVALYEAAQSENGNEFQNLEALAATIKGDVPRDWVFDAAKVLQTRALADCIFTFGATEAKITGQGRLYVESEGGFTKKAQESPATYYNVTVSGSGIQVVTGRDISGVSQTIRQPVSPGMRLLDEMSQKIQNDDTLSGPTRLEATTYISLLRFEVAKPQPNHTLIATLLESLSKIASIAGSVASFIHLLNAAS
jgi:hypothetical protein